VIARINGADFSRGRGGSDEFLAAACKTGASECNFCGQQKPPLKKGNRRIVSTWIRLWHYLFFFSINGAEVTENFK
jgi:hypothetical protein